MYLFISAIIIGLSSAQKTICTAKGEFGPSVDFLCAPGASLVINQMCCDVTKVRNVACEDELDVNGNSLCPLSRLGCYRNLLGSLIEEITLCSKTCQYCPMPPICLIRLLNADPKLIYLKNVSPMVISKITGVETGSALYVSSNDDNKYLKGIFVQSGDTVISLDEINENNDDGTAKHFSIIDGLTISTSNDYTVSSTLTGFIFVTTKEQADDPAFSVYVIKTNHTVSTTVSNSTVVILNTSLGNDTSFKSSYIQKIDQAPDFDLHFHFGYPGITVAENRFFENPVYIDHYNDHGIIVNSSRVFFDTVEPIQIGLDYWYLTSSGPISLEIENKYIPDFNHTTTSINSTGVIMNNNYVFDGHTVHFELDYGRIRTVGMLITATPSSDLHFIYTTNDSEDAFRADFTNGSHVSHQMTWSQFHASKLAVNSSSTLPGTFFCQYFGFSADLIPTTVTSSTTVIPTTSEISSSTVTIPTTVISTTSDIMSSFSTVPISTTVNATVTSGSTVTSTHVPTTTKLAKGYVKYLVIIIGLGHFFV